MTRWPQCPTKPQEGTGRTRDLRDLHPWLQSQDTAGEACPPSGLLSAGHVQAGQRQKLQEVADLGGSAGRCLPRAVSAGAQRLGSAPELLARWPGTGTAWCGLWHTQDSGKMWGGRV